VAVKNRASLLKTLTRWDRCSKTFLARIETDSMWTLNSGDARELAQTSRQIARVHLNMMKLSRELASVSRQIRGLMAGKARCLPMPTLVTSGNHRTHGCKAHRTRNRRPPRLRQLPAKTVLLWCASWKAHQAFGTTRSMVALKPGRRRRALPTSSINDMALTL
jgi:hypothetical protein